MPPTRTPRLKARVAIEHDGQILCVLHAKPDQEPFWCLPGGNVDNAESLSDAACRELLEEVGVTVQLDGALLILDGPSVDAVEVIFRGTITAGSAAMSAASGDAYLAEARWFDRLALPANFRPASLRQLLSGPTPLAALQTVAVGDWLAR
jgi:8-oxo-dGTP diphosphatase